MYQSVEEVLMRLMNGSFRGRYVVPELTPIAATKT